MRVLKLGGQSIADAPSISTLARALAASPESTIIVHGGGDAVDDLQRRLGSEPVKIGGMRQTDPQTLEAVIMTLCGSVSAGLTAGLVAHGVPAVGLSGLDGGLLRCRKLEVDGADLGFVGEIVAVETSILEALLEAGITPLVAPVSLGEDGAIYNVNADLAAGAIAQAMDASLLDFVSDVPGVLEDGRLVASLSDARVAALIASGAVQGGMLPKIQTAVQALHKGVRSVRIVDLEGLLNGGGTTFVRTGETPKPEEERIHEA